MAVKVLIGADEREYVATNDINIRQQAGSISSSSVEILLGANTIPQTLESCQILIDDVPQFFGIIQSVDTPQFEFGYEVRRYALQVSSAEVIFNNRLVSESLTDVYTHEIVDTIFDNYIAFEGITLGQISTTTRSFESYIASFLKAGDVFSELADEIGAVCFVSPDKKFYFLNQTDFAQVTKPEKITAMSKSEKAQDLRSVQTVTGAKEDTTEQTRTLTWITGQMEQLLAYPLSKAPFASINAGSVGVGLAGVDEEDTSKTFLWTYGSDKIRVNSNALVKPVNGDTVSFLYEGFYDVLVTNVNDQLVSELALLSGTSGRIERIYTDETINSYQDADTLSFNLLSQFGQRESEISLTCHDLVATQINNMWTFDDEPYVSLGITGQYVVVERTISRFSETEFTVLVKLRNKNFFSRYGTVFNKLDKKVRENTIIYKTSSIGDIMLSVENYQFDNKGIPIFPSSTQTYSPLGFPFYPIDFGTQPSVLPYEVGDVLEDGSVVFYVTDGGMHGLIASPAGWNGGTSDPLNIWSNVEQNLTTGTAIGTGLSNTLAIMAQSGHTSSAAKLCYDFRGKYSGRWFLPSLDELSQMFLQNSIINGLSNDVYGASTEYSFYLSYHVSMDNGQVYWGRKISAHEFRPIRSF